MAKIAMGRILRWGSLQLCQSLVNGLYHGVSYLIKQIDCQIYKKQAKKSGKASRKIITVG